MGVTAKVPVDDTDKPGLSIGIPMKALIPFKSSDSTPILNSKQMGFTVCIKRFEGNTTAESKLNPAAVKTRSELFAHREIDIRRKHGIHLIRDVLRFNPRMQP